MHRELANRANPRVGDGLGGYDTVANTGVLMKMSDADSLRYEQKRRAENSDGARRRSTAFAKPG